MRQAVAPGVAEGPSQCRIKGEYVLTCQLVSNGRPVMVIRWTVRRGLGAMRGPASYPSRGRVAPRANCTTRRSPMNSEPSNQRYMSAGEYITMEEVWWRCPKAV